jgi:hypothetical protein
MSIAGTPAHGPERGRGRPLVPLEAADEGDVPQLTPLDPVAKLAKGGSESLPVADLEDDMCPLGGSPRRSRLIRSVSAGLLRKDVDARGREAPDRVEMRRCRRRDDRGIDLIRGDELRDRTESAELTIFRERPRLGCRVGDGNDVESSGSVERVEVRPAHPAQADEPNPHAHGDHSSGTCGSQPVFGVSPTTALGRADSGGSRPDR